MTSLIPPAAAYAAYRERHVIEPITPPEYRRQGIGGGYYICEHDGIRVHRVMGGWQHVADDVREIRQAATPPDGWPK